jgi:UDP-N-acetylmuramoyl-tripeptide--D-alanyl-D-alanine ligase
MRKKGAAIVELQADEIARATGGAWVAGKAPDGLVLRALTTDTRRIAAGDLFVALRGERFDAHDFLDQAASAGAGALVARRDWQPTASVRAAATPVLAVDDTLRALGDIAAAWRAKCPAQRVAVVGSSGKTTTKEMLAAILRAAGPTHASAGNFNNLVGVPLSLLGLEPDDRWCVVELGMNEPGELTRLTQIANPDMLLLLNIGSAHIGQFGSQDALVRAKGEAVRALRADAPILYDADSPHACRIVHEWGGEHPLVAFGVEREAEVHAANVEARPPRGYAFDLWVGADCLRVELPVFGRYNVVNAVAAAAAAHALGAPHRAIVEALAAFRPAAMRSEVRDVAGVTLIVDCYNANPDSMRAALESLAEWRAVASGRDAASGRAESSVRAAASGRDAASGPAAASGRLFLVLADMLELGEESPARHADLGRQAARVGAAEVLVLGQATQHTTEACLTTGTAAHHFDTHEALAAHLAAAVVPGDLVFFKGSRGNRLERVVDALSARLEGVKGR